MDNKIYAESKAVYCYFCNGLFTVSKNSFGTKRVASLCKLFRVHKDPKEKFQ